MNTKSKISLWQIFSIMLVSRLLSTITFMPVLNMDMKSSDYIAAALISGLSLFLFFIPAFFITKRKRGILEISEGISDKFAKIIAFLYAVFFILNVYAILTRMDIFVSAVVFPQKSTALFMVAGIVAVCYAASHGLEALGRAGTVSMVVFIASFIVILLSLIERIKINNLSPVFYDGVKPVVYIAWAILVRTVEPAALMIILPRVSGNALKSFTAWIVSITFITTLVSFCLMTSFGDSAMLQLFPVHSMAVLSQFGVFERMDSLLTGMWIMAAFVKVSFLIFLVSELLSYSLKKVNKNLITVFIGIAASTAVLLQSNELTSFNAATSLILKSVTFVIFSVLIPAALIIADKFRLGAKEQ